MSSRFSKKNIVILTGAGISAESGLKTFRDADGLWEGHRVENVATPEAFAKNPELVHRFYNLRRKQLQEVKPNLAHEALAKFEADHDSGFVIITQNVDDLHERAGSKNVIHMHGELKKARHLKSGEITSCEEDLKPNGLLRPHICWFGEMPFQMDEIEAHLLNADYFIVIGTSGVVYPAAGFVGWVKLSCKKILLNKEETSQHSLFDEVRVGLASEIVPDYLQG
jgi:NAD-dependent deacetylase